jgi:S1-C subfamily serine protease
MDQPPHRTPGVAWLAAILLTAVALVGGYFIGRSMIAGPAPAPRVVTPRGDLAADEQATIELFEVASPSVVHITTLAQPRGLRLSPEAVPTGTGSGFVWDSAGHVVTNFHVVAGASGAQVALADHSVWPAELVGVYPDKDIAVLRIGAPASRLYPLAIGTSADLRVGQKAIAIGNPFGLDQTLTTGVISALGREIESMNDRTIRDVIQTDAAINPGNSGGPLLDSAGRVIGVNTAIFSPSGVYSGIGFAIPIDEVRRVVPQIISNGRVIRPSIGIQVAGDQVARQLGLSGVLIARVEPGSPAEAAGLRPTRWNASGGLEPGDVITGIDGKPLRSVDELLDALERHAPGDRVTLTLQRNGSATEVGVDLASGQ